MGEVTVKGDKSHIATLCVVFKILFKTLLKFELYVKLKYLTIRAKRGGNQSELNCYIVLS